MEKITKTQNVYDYFCNEVVNKTNVDVSIALSHIITLSDAFLDITETSNDNEELPIEIRMRTKVTSLGVAIKALAKNAEIDFHKMEKEHIKFFTEYKNVAS